MTVHPVRRGAWVGVLVVALHALHVSAASQALQWAGEDVLNRRFVATDPKIKPDMSPPIAKWRLTVDGDTSATPVVSPDGIVYFPCFRGQLYAVRAATGEVVWKRRVSDYVEAMPDGTMSRSSPALDLASGLLIVGTQFRGLLSLTPGQSFGPNGCYVLAINRLTGDLVWHMQADLHPAAMITQSATLHDGAIYVGVSSFEEFFSAIPGYRCCTFRGSFMKLRLSDGAQLWRTYMIPEPPPGTDPQDWWSGAAVWGSAPSIDTAKRQVYIATGNTYILPKAVLECQRRAGSNIAAKTACSDDYQNGLGRKVYQSTIMALDLATGAVKWARILDAPTAYTVACSQFGLPRLFPAFLVQSNIPVPAWIRNLPNPVRSQPWMVRLLTKLGIRIPLVTNPLGCPDPDSTDFDFAQAPMVLNNVCVQGVCRNMVVAGQKSGWLWSLNPDNGEVWWGTQTGPGSERGGIMFGSATDGKNIYASNANLEFRSFTLINSRPNRPGQPAPTTTDGGLLASVDAFTGNILWMFANAEREEAVVPNPNVPGAEERKMVNSGSLAPVTVVNGVVLYPSIGPKGTLYFVRASDGGLLHTFDLGAGSNCGPAVVDGVVYTGSGYKQIGINSPGNTFWALTTL